MIGLDWGTTSLRAWRFGADGAVLARREAPTGITQLPAGGFEAAFAAIASDWLAAGERAALICGMAGSRQGWLEVPYVDAPAGLAEIAAGARPLPLAPASALILPGLRWRDADGVPEVMRGEETQALGLIAAGRREATLCSPGTHAKWVRIAEGRIAGFTTYMTGDAFAALSRHTILRHSVTAEPPDGGVPPGFRAGLAQAKRPGGLLRQMFGLRARGLMGEIAESEGAGFLSGLLIGHEVAAALEAGVAPPVVLTGAPGLVACYGAALDAFGVPHEDAGADLAAAGLAALGRAMGLMG